MGIYILGTLPGGRVPERYLSSAGEGGGGGRRRVHEQGMSDCTIEQDHRTVFMNECITIYRALASGVAVRRSPSVTLGHRITAATAPVHENNYPTASAPTAGIPIGGRPAGILPYEHTIRRGPSLPVINLYGQSSA